MNYDDKKNLTAEDSLADAIIDEQALDVATAVEKKLETLTARSQDVLFEIGTEELPAGHIDLLAQALGDCLANACAEAGLSFVEMQCYSSPRRLAVILQALATRQDEQIVERLGPQRDKAFNEKNVPTPAGLGFVRSCGLPEKSLHVLASLFNNHSGQVIRENAGQELGLINTDKGQRLYFKQKTTGKLTQDLLPTLIDNALSQLHLVKPMRWGTQSTEFVRPVHWVTLLYGEQLIDTTVLGVKTGAVTYGHRFHHPGALTLTHPSDYVEKLRTEGYVLVDVEARRTDIKQRVHALADKVGEVVIEEDLLAEVADLVEYPQALMGEFDARFLALPEEALIAVMRKHQRCFYVRAADKKLAPYFIVVSNIQSKAPKRIIAGNARVMHARLADAEFFFQADCKRRLDSYLDDLKQVSFQEALGSLYDKAQRLSKLAEKIAVKTAQENPAFAARAGLLAKSDLLTHLVAEFPTLNGIIGYYYAKREGEPAAVATALKELYSPQSAQAPIPQTPIGCALAIAERVDTLVGLFGIHQPPTGEKDPFALRRAALGVLRIIIEAKLRLDLRELIQWTVDAYALTLPNTQVEEAVLQFSLERLRAWYIDKGISPVVFAAVFARCPTEPLDFDQRIHAVAQFHQLAAAKALAAAHKRINSFLKKESRATMGTQQPQLDNNLLEEPAEKALAAALQKKIAQLEPLYAARAYTEALTSLAELREVVDCFFDKVLVMTEDKRLRENRFALLIQMRNLFTAIADISLLQE